MIKLALIGEGIGYSLSPKIQKIIFNELNEPLSYELISFSAAEIRSKLGMLAELDGFSVTKPHKNLITEYLENGGDGAVNTVKVENGNFFGFNTDGLGFSLSLKRHGINVANKNVLVLGAGGVAFPICNELVKAKANVYICNRTKEKAIALAEKTKAKLFDLTPPEIIINCTTMGLKEENSLPSDVVLNKIEFALDTIYSPPLTPFLSTAKANGAKIVNGLEMLIYQAIKADEIFLNRNFSDSCLNSLFDTVFKELA